MGASSSKPLYQGPKNPEPHKSRSEDTSWYLSNGTNLDPRFESGANSTAIGGLSSQPAVNVLQNAQGITLNGGNILAAGRDIIITTVQTPTADEVKTMAKWITLINFRAVWMDTIAKKAPGTGTWLPRTSKFREWGVLERGILCGTGLPGAGKTVLSSIVVEQLREACRASSQDCAVLVVFFRYTDKITARDTYAALVRQLLEDHPGVFDLVKSLYMKHDRHGTILSKVELIQLLREATNLLRRCFITLDAFDEAPKEVQLEIFQTLCSMKVNIFATSRPSILPKDVLAKAQVLEIVAQREDIEILVREKIKKNAEFRALLAEHSQTADWEAKIVSKVQERSRGMFLVAALQLEMLQLCLNLGELEETLENLPEGVKEMYQATVRRIQEQPRNSFLLAQSIFLWLLHSRRPLKIKELRNAAAISMQTCIFDETRVVSGDRLISVCCGLVTVDTETHDVRLIHYTTFDALKEIFPFDNESPHSFIAAACTRYLLDHNVNDYDEHHHNAQGFESFLFKFPLLEYAHSNWAFHVCEAQSFPQDIVQFVNQCQRFPIIWYRKTGILIHPFLVAVWYNLPQYYDFLESDSSTDIAMTERLDTALTLAAYQGHVDIVRKLLTAPGVDINVKNEDMKTALRIASGKGHTEIVAQLLQCKGISPNIQDSEGGTAILAASTSNQTQITRMLLQCPGIAVNVQDSAGCTALITASFAGFEEIVEMVLDADDTGVNIKLASPNGRDALICASLRGCAPVYFS
ncbi:hypothetical protein FA15DRAFT_635561 [Coprinopsis marcescibilis]|uniref:Uncharacterized protein n=1 Tax=Coprinopsis marcescibilis TaxID=230819 RepID=A0A5C3L4U9_COPMA|nr:hypothetical protein FA15DRAFT_635561 [Coprinopsis marcescibilis]